MHSAERNRETAVAESSGFTMVYLFTTFPKSTETFMQREVRAMLARGVNLRVYSLLDQVGDFMV